MKKSLNALVTVVGLVSAFITFTDHLPQYHEVFKALLYISVGLIWGSFLKQDAPAESVSAVKQPLLNALILLFLPSIIFVPLTLVLYFTGNLSSEFLEMLLTIALALTVYVFAAALPSIIQTLLPKK